MISKIDEGSGNIHVELNPSVDFHPNYHHLYTQFAGSPLIEGPAKVICQGVGTRGRGAVVGAKPRG